GGTLLGTFYDENLIDEVHLFLAPKLIGGIEAPSPLAGQGRDRVPDAGQLEQMSVKQLGSDLYVHGYFRADQNGTST
ncbi:MAG: dihydrofolate reductase family protein, partial [Planctomycetaceae bacterium]|nr:dihydrofolate reductase family protein [Planctomycetaceae bacterium]